MKAIDLFKFVSDNEVEYHWHDKDVILMPDFAQTKELNKLLSPSIFDDDGIACTMRDGYFCIYMECVCSYYGIELIDVFPNKNNE